MLVQVLLFSLEDDHVQSILSASRRGQSNRKAELSDVLSIFFYLRQKLRPGIYLQLTLQKACERICGKCMLLHSDHTLANSYTREESLGSFPVPKPLCFLWSRDTCECWASSTTKAKWLGSHTMGKSCKSWDTVFPFADIFSPDLFLFGKVNFNSNYVLSAHKMKCL
jgi:hypothetical protein